ncbi:MAG TPA: helix-turn-helix domain-containing protein [Actinomycetota bacterium]|nr:helix-turn-helix domain-containing protein [Actinomycetota bacterium]
MSANGTGIGRALRTARLRRGKSLEEASRETRVKTEYLQALEVEAFDSLLGDVYVRGFLRSYARYLGLNPEKVVAFYQRAYRRDTPAPAPLHRAPGVVREPLLEPKEHKHRTAWILAAGAAVIVLISAAAVGLLSRETPAPTPAAPAQAAAVPVAPEKVQVDIVAEEAVGASVIVDGRPELGFNGLLEAGEAHSFEGERSIEVHLDSGYRAEMVVNGESLGRPGMPNRPYERTFTAEDFRGKKG